MIRLVGRTTERDFPLRPFERSKSSLAASRPSISAGWRTTDKAGVSISAKSFIERKERDHGVSRFSIHNTYAQLTAEGYFESLAGSGTVISTSLPERFTVSQPVGARSATPRLGSRTIARHTSPLPLFRRPPWLSHPGAFAVGQVALDQFPIKLWSNLVARGCRELGVTSMGYGSQMGSMFLREMIANYLRTARSVRCGPEQVMIVSDSQQALDISGRVLLDPGSSVWVEEPGYQFARDVLTLSGCHLVPVPVDREGLMLPPESSSVERRGRQSLHPLINFHWV